MANPQFGEPDFTHLLPEFEPAPGPAAAPVAPIVLGDAPDNPYLRALGPYAYPASTGDVLAATAGVSANDLPGLVTGPRWLGRLGSDLEAIGGGGEWLSGEEAERRYGFEFNGKKALTFPPAISDAAARELAALKKRELLRGVTLARAQGGVFEGGLQLLTGLAVSAIDPLNLATAFIPVVGEARYLQLLRQASGPIGRLGVRSGVGAVEGLAGAALIEPLVYGLATSEQQDYTLNDSLYNLLFGTALGAGLHGGFGAIGDRFGVSQLAQANRAEALRIAEDARVRIEEVRVAAAKGQDFADTFDVFDHLQNLNRAADPDAPPSALQRSLDDLDPEQRGQVWQASIADFAEHGRIVHSGEAVRLVADPSPDNLRRFADGWRAREEFYAYDREDRAALAEQAKLREEVEQLKAAAKPPEPEAAKAEPQEVMRADKDEAAIKATQEVAAKIARDPEGLAKSYLAEKRRYDKERLATREQEPTGDGPLTDKVVLAHVARMEKIAAGFGLRYNDDRSAFIDVLFAIDKEDRSFHSAAARNKRAAHVAREWIAANQAAEGPRQPAAAIEKGPETIAAQAELARVLDALDPTRFSPEQRAAIEAADEGIARAEADAAALLEAARCANRGGA